MEEDASPTHINRTLPGNLDNLVTLVAYCIPGLDLYPECSREIFKSVITYEK